MRTIKFRGRSIHTDKWHYGDLFRPNENTSFIYEKGTAGVLCSHIGQFTGMFDYSKKEIWEDDIVNVSCLNYTGLAVIKFIDGAFCMVGENWIESLNGFDTDSLDIIGNIHDNPELLKGGNDE